MPPDYPCPVVDTYLFTMFRISCLYQDLNLMQLRPLSSSSFTPEFLRISHSNPSIHPLLPGADVQNNECKPSSRVGENQRDSPSLCI